MFRFATMTFVIVQCNTILYFYLVKYSVIFLVSIMLFIRPLVPVVDYIVNYDYIKSVLCINKFNPEKKCNGKCHLKKELEDVFNDKKNDKAPLKSSISEEVTALFYQKIINFSFGSNKSIASYKIIPYFTDNYSYNFTKEYFHPPCPQI